MKIKILDEAMNSAEQEDKEESEDDKESGSKKKKEEKEVANNSAEKGRNFKGVVGGGDVTIENTETVFDSNHPPRPPNNSENKNLVRKILNEVIKNVLRTQSHEKLKLLGKNQKFEFNASSVDKVQTTMASNKDLQVKNEKKRFVEFSQTGPTAKKNNANSAQLDLPPIQRILRIKQTCNIAKNEKKDMTSSASPPNKEMNANSAQLELPPPLLPILREVNKENTTRPNSPHPRPTHQKVHLNPIINPPVGSTLLSPPQPANPPVHPPPTMKTLDKFEMIKRKFENQTKKPTHPPTDRPLPTRLKTTDPMATQNQPPTHPPTKPLPNNPKKESGNEKLRKKLSNSIMDKFTLMLAQETSKTPPKKPNANHQPGTNQPTLPTSLGIKKTTKTKPTKTLVLKTEKENKKLEASLRAWLTADNNENENLQKSKNLSNYTVGKENKVAENEIGRKRDQACAGGERDEGHGAGQHNVDLQCD